MYRIALASFFGPQSLRNISLGRRNKINIHTWPIHSLWLDRLFFCLLAYILTVFKRFEDDCLLGCCAVLSGRSLPIPETSVKIYQITRRNSPEDSHLPTRRHQNLKSHVQTI
jgi:hypothetical protein